MATDHNLYDHIIVFQTQYLPSGLYIWDNHRALNTIPIMDPAGVGMTLPVTVTAMLTPIARWLCINPPWSSNQRQQKQDQ